MADSQDSWDPETPGSSEEQPSIPVIKQDRKSKKKSSKNKNENKTTKKRKSDETSAGNVNEEQNPTKPEKKSKKRISDEDIPGTSKEETRNPTKTGNKSKKRKSAEDIPGTSKNETHNPTEPGSKSKKRKSAEDKPGTSQDEVPGNPDIEPTKQNGSDMQNSSNPEFKCCKKRCVHNIDSQVRERLHQEYKEQSDRGIEFGRSDLCKYIYPCKLEKDNDGSRRYQYRIPQQVPFDDDDQKKEICQKAFLEIFEMKEHTLRSARRVIDDIQIKLEMKEELPLNDDDVCGEGEPANETETMSMTRNDFTSATDGVRMIPKVKEEPVEYNWVDVKTEPTLERQCRCINSAPIHFNSDSGAGGDEYKMQFLGQNDNVNFGRFKRWGDFEQNFDK